MRIRWVAALVAGLLWSAGASPVLPVQAAPGCGALDRPETGIPGEVPLADQLNGRAKQGYNCGVAVVGYNNLGGRGGNGNMAWSGDCAYITGDGIAVVDVHDPRQPRLVQTLHGPGTNASLESVAAIDVGSRHLLAAGRYGLFGYTGLPGSAPVDIYDTTDCAHPRKLSTIKFPTNVHGLMFAADGRRLFSTLPLQAADVSDPLHPTYLGDIEKDVRKQSGVVTEMSHEAWPSPDGTRMYIGGQVPGDEHLLILDIHDWPSRRATVVGKTKLPGHSIRPMTINGKRYLLNSDETIPNPTAKGCVPALVTPAGGASQPYLTDISDEHAPRAVSQFRLPINNPQNCAREIADGENASVHYHDVDDPDHTTFALLSMWHAGLRIVDVRDPARPTEAAYFNPGQFGFKRPTIDPARPYLTAMGVVFTSPLDQAWAHIRYQPATGLIWFTTHLGGFWVLELEPQVRARLALPATPAYHALGSNPRPAASRFTATPASTLNAMYCTVSAAGAIAR